MEVIVTLLFAGSRDVLLTNIAHDCTAICADHLVATVFFDEFDSALRTSPHHRLTPGFFHLVTSTKSFIVLGLLTSSR